MKLFLVELQPPSKTHRKEGLIKANQTQAMITLEEMALSIYSSMKYLSSPFGDDNDGKTGLGLEIGGGFL